MRPFALPLVLGLVFISWFANAVKIRILADGIGSRISVWSCFRAHMANLFLSAVTPFQTGGGAAQIYVLWREGLSVSRATAASLAGALITIVFLFSGGVAVLVIRPGLAENIAVRVVTIFVITVFCFAFFLFWVGFFKPQWVSGIVRVAARVAERVPFVPKDRVREFHDWFSQELADLIAYLRIYLTDRLGVLLKAAPLGGISILANCLIAYAIMFGMRISRDPGEVLMAQMLIYFIVYFSPSPGGSGVAEAGGASLMAALIPLQQLCVYIVLWRFFSYLLGVGLGAVVIMGLLRSGTQDAERILVIRPDRLGDVVLATPLIHALRDRYPNAYIAALVRPYTEAVLLGNPRLDRILLDDPAGRDSGFRGFWSLVFRLRRERFGTSLMLMPTRRHALAVLLGGIPRRISVGRKPYEVLTGSKPAGRNRDDPVRHEADYCLDLGRVVGVECGDLRPEVFLDEEERAEARGFLEAAGLGTGTVVGVHPGSGGSAPNWDRERYRTLVRGLVETLGSWIVVTGDGSEPRMDWGGEGWGERVLDLTGQLTVRRLMSVLSCFDVLVSSSTGPMHLAAALGIPCVAMFCPRKACSPARWGPLGNGHRIIVPGSERCGRCGPTRDPECRFQDIPVSDVLAMVSGIVG